MYDELIKRLRNRRMCITRFMTDYIDTAGLWNERLQSR